MFASVIALGTMVVFAQNGTNSTLTLSEEDAITITGTITSIDDRGFTMESDSVSYNVRLPYSFDRSALDLQVGSEVTVTGFSVECLNLSSSVFHATSINGITIDYEPQQQLQTRAKDGSGDCGGNGGNGRMGGNGQHRGGMKG